MFEHQQSTVKEDTSYKYKLYRKERAISYAQFLALLAQSEAFQQFFITLLKEVPFRAYHWETPAVISSNIDQPFEFVVTRTPGIDLPPDPGPFRQYFRADKKVSVFDNLGGDAKLIAPTPADQQLNYSHIGVFTENANEDQQQALWETVGRVTNSAISDQPLWLNTAGGGVAWLHIRLDSSPKYYRHHPYTSVN